MTPKELRELVEEAYREGFSTGSTEASNYERGGHFTKAGDCWEYSDAKNALGALMSTI